jgi:hypothetical protein
MQQPNITWTFPLDITANDAINAVAAFYGVGVSINGGAASVPAHLKQAVEQFGAGGAGGFDPASGVEVNPAIAFSALMNGAASPNVNAQSFAGVATSAIAPTASADISATSVLASSAPVVPPAPLEAAQPGVAASGNPVIIDKDGLPHDVRIHSKDPTLTDKGYWRKKRGVTDDLVRTVEAQLRSIGNLPVPAAAQVASGANELQRKAEAIKYAHDEAVRVCGPQPMDDSTLQGLLNGKTATLSPEQADWYHAYFGKRNAAYGEFISRPLIDAPVAPIVAAIAPVAPISTPALPETDAAGLPWDARINLPMINGAGLKDANGVYLQRMDVSGEEKLSIMAQLRGNGAGTPSTVPNGGAGTTPVAPIVPSVPQISAADAGTSFANMMRWLVQNKIANRVSDTQVADVAKSFGFVDGDGNGAVALMASRVDYFPALVATLQAYGAV